MGNAEALGNCEAQHLTGKWKFPYHGSVINVRLYHRGARLRVALAGTV